MPPTASENVDALLNQQSVLARFGGLALRSDDLDEILTEACRLVGEALGTDLAKVMELQDDGVTLLVRAGVGWKPGVVGRTTVEAEEGSSEARALRTGEPVTSQDIDAESRFTCAEFLAENGVKAFVNVIIIGAEGHSPFGILEVDSRKPRAFTDDDIAFLQTYANLLAAAVERLRMLQGMREVLRENDRQARRMREEDLRRRIAVEVGEVGLWDYDLVAGTLHLDERMRAMNGVTSGDGFDGMRAFDAIHPDDRERVEEDLGRLAAGEADTLAIQYRIIGIEDGKLRTVLVNGRALRDGEGRVSRLIGAARDVTDRAAADERRTVLNAELAHRLKNTLAVVQSIVTQTLRTAPDLQTGREALVQRIQALSKAHDILLTGQRDAASLRDVVRAAVALHDEGRRVEMTGPDISLGPKASLTLSLIVHELSTNAGKYGALSSPEGHVHVEWSVAANPATGVPVLTFEWREIGGPPVIAPERRSFGTRLIQMGLSGASEGSVDLDYAPSGVRCRIVASLNEVQTAEEAEG